MAATRDQESHVLQTAQDALSENTMKEEHSHQIAAREDRLVRIQKEELLVVTDHAEVSERTARDHVDLSVITLREELSVATDHVEASEKTTRDLVEATERTAKDHADLSVRTLREELLVVTDHVEALVRAAREEASAAAEDLLLVAEVVSTQQRKA